MADETPIVVIEPADFYPGAVGQSVALRYVETEAALSLAERKRIVEQAAVLFELHYAHLPLKRAMHGVDPVQLLKLVRTRLEDTSPDLMPGSLAFHREVLSIFNTVRDLHTRYILPETFTRSRVILPFTVGEYFAPVSKDSKEAVFFRPEWGRVDDEHVWAARYLVTRLLDGFRDHPGRPSGFDVGAELVYWNGVRMPLAVQNIADQFAGSNAEARRTRGVAGLTQRELAHTISPDEEWVDIVYRPVGDGEEDEPASPEELCSIRTHWAFIRDAQEAEEEPADEDGGEKNGDSEDDELREILRDLLGIGKEPDEPGNRQPACATDEEIRQALRQEVLADDGTLKGAAPEDLTRGLEAATDRGFDPVMDAMQRQEYRLYQTRAGAEVPAPGERQTIQIPHASGQQRPAEVVLETIEVYVPEEDPVLAAATIEIAAGDGDAPARFGYVRIFTFDVSDVDEFVDTVAGILEGPELGRAGLVLDVRGNGGGRIPAGERLLQLLTPRRIEPERLQFVSTPGNLEFCRRYDQMAKVSGGDSLFEPWIESLEDAVETGDVYSRGFSLTSASDCNDVGQKYQGPVVLLTDANCYSTTDIFAAGFKDHEIGQILGVHGNTGAGGANNVRHSALMRVWGDRAPYQKLPQGADMTVSLRRTLRVRDRAGMPLEDLGVKPDVLYRLTRRDLLEGDVGLIGAAIDLLRKA